MPQPLEIDAVEEPLLNAYRNAWLRVLSEQEQLAADPIRAARSARLAEMRARIEADMDELDGAARAWIQNQLPKVYALGATTGTAEATGGLGEMAWTQINQEAVQRLATGLFHELLGSTKHVRKTTKQLIRKVARDEALQSAITGRTATQAAASMRKLLEVHNIHAVRYSDGSKHGLAEYSRMAMRTTTATAYNEGTLDGASAQGVKFWEVFDGPECGWSAHDQGELALGKIVTEDEAREFPISHPNCRRAFGARPDVESKAQAEAAKEAEPLSGGDAHEALKSITPSQEVADVWQKDGRFKTISSYLRNGAGEMTGSEESQILDYVETLDAHMQPVPARVSVTRTMPGRDLGIEGRADIDRLVGGTITDRSFVSTSTGRFERGDLTLDIDVPEGTPGMYIGGLKSAAEYGGENELLLGRNLTMDVLSYDPGRHALQVRVRSLLSEPTAISAQREQDAARLARQQRVSARKAKREGSQAKRDARIAAQKAKAEKVAPASPVEAIEANTGTPSVGELINKGYSPTEAVDAHAAAIAVEAPAVAPPASVQALVDQDAQLSSAAQPLALYDSTGPGGLTKGGGRVYDGRWWTNIKQDTAPGTAIPVHGVTVEKYKIQSGIAVRRNGRAYLLEIEPGTVASAADLAKLEEAVQRTEGVLSKLPPKIQGHQRAITITKGNNPADAHWAQVYNKPGFKSAATGGSGNTTFWNAPVRPGTIMHELGHNVDAATGINGAWFTDVEKASGSSAWHRAQSADGFSSPYHADAGFQTSIYGGHPVTPGTAGVTEYGAENIREDFAESVRLYLTDRHTGYLGYSGGTSVRFADVYPGRAAVLDQLFGFQSATTPFQLKQIEQAAQDILAEAHNIASIQTLHTGTLSTKYGISGTNVAKAKAQATATLVKQAEETAKVQAATMHAAAEAAAKTAAATMPGPKLLANDISFADKTGIGVKAANAKKAAIKAGATPEEAKAIFSATKAKLTAEKLAELNGVAVEAEEIVQQQVVALTHAQISGIGAKAGNAKKAALAEGKSAAEAQIVFNETKAALTAEKLAELNGTGVQVVTQAQKTATSTAGHMVPGRKASKATAYLKDAGAAPHPKAKIQRRIGSTNDAQAKSNIAAALGEHMNNPEDWALFRTYSTQVYGVDPGDFYSPNPAFTTSSRFGIHTAESRGLTAPDEIRQHILDSEAANRVQQWAGTSGDKTVQSTAMQQAVKEEFGTTGSAIVRAETDAAYMQSHDEFYAKVAPFYRRFVRRMYEHTQDDLAEQGITTISVDRGMSFSARPGFADSKPEWAQIGTQSRPDLQPANSWSTSKAVANRFGNVRFSAVIPADRVLGSARTGFGCYSEKEFVVLVSDGLAQVDTF